MTAWQDMMRRSMAAPACSESGINRREHAASQGANVGRLRQTRPQGDYAATVHGSATEILRRAGFDRNGQPIRHRPKPVRPAPSRKARQAPTKAPPPAPVMVAGIISAPPNIRRDIEQSAIRRAAASRA